MHVPLDKPNHPPVEGSEDRVVQTSPPYHLMGETPVVGNAQAVASVPTIAGRYQICEELARGGMGVVYRAHDSMFGREIAVKLLNDELRQTPRAISRFLAEAYITGQLQHPGVPPVFEVGKLPDGSPYLAMKLVKGPTLKDLLANRKDTSHERGRFLAIFEQITQAVGYAHDHKVIHRDLKPANVMVGAFGEVQVMDWGLAKVLPEVRANYRPSEESTLGTEIHSYRDEDDRTRAGAWLGTPAYMSPEQAIGAVDLIDEQSDVFGLGGILCSILTSKPPYPAPSPESARQLAARAKLDDTFARLDGSGAEPELVTLCKRCLSLEKNDRPSNAGEVAKAVAELRAAAEQRARQAELDLVRAEAERAKAELRLAAQRNRDAAVASLGRALSAIGDFKKAIADRRAAFKIDSKYADCSDLGSALRDAGDLGEAAIFREAAKHAPGLGVVESRFLDELIESLRTAKETDPKDDNAREMLRLVVAASTNRYLGAAISILHEFLETDPTNAHCQEALARALERKAGLDALEGGSHDPQEPKSTDPSS